MNPPRNRPSVTRVKRDGSIAASTAAVSLGSHDRPPLVPMLKCGSSPSNKRGIAERIEWQSYTTTRGWMARSRSISAASAAW